MVFLAAVMLTTAGNAAQVSYRIITNPKVEPATLSGTARYFGGEVRVIFINGKPTRLPQAGIIANVRKGHFLPVYTKTGARLSRQDWISCLPQWLAYETLAQSGPVIPDEQDR